MNTPKFEIYGPSCKQCDGVLIDTCTRRNLRWMKVCNKCGMTYPFDEASLDMFYDNIDQLVIDKKFDELDRGMENIDVSETPLIMILSYLTITLPVRNQLKNRKDLYERTFQMLVEKKKSSQEIYGKLQGLS